MKKYIFTALLLQIAISGLTQSLFDTKLSDRKGVLRFYFTLNSMNNPNFAFSDFTQIKYKTFGFDGEIYDFDQGEDRWYMSSKICDDLIWLIGATIKDTDDNRHYSNTGLFSFKYGYNIYSNNKINVSAGFSLTDYMVILPEVDSAGYYQGNRMEPHGWYWAAGPNIFLDYHLFDTFTLHANVNYDFSFLTLNKGSNVDVIDGYKRPHAFGMRFTLNHDAGLFVQYHWTTTIDKGPHLQNITRRELQFGYRFFLG